MSRVRVAVALLPPHELSGQLHALRRLLGDPRLDVIPPHLTLVPPVNLSGGELVELRGALRSVATACDPFTLGLGPAATFAPATPTLHLAVSGDEASLSELRTRLRVTPVDRPDEWPFTPHVTLRESMPEAQLDGAIATLSAPMADWSVDRLYVLQQFRDEHGVRWRAVAEEPFGGPDVVGRGGVELRLRTVEMLEPEVWELIHGAEPEEPASAARSWLDAVAEDHTLVVAAETAGPVGVPIAAVLGSAGAGGAVIETLHVHPEHQGMGIGRQVVARWCVEAARRGADMATADPEVADGALVAWGFSRVGGLLVRQLVHERAE